MSHSPRLLEFSVRIYSRLIRAYPASFRREYAAEMIQVFRDLATDALDDRGRLGLFGVWYRVFGDLLRTAPQEHLREFQRRIAMKKTAFALLSVVLATIIYFYITAAILFSYVAIAVLFNDNWFKVSQWFIAFEHFQLVIVFLPAFGTGMILTRVKPFFKPWITAPLGTMVFGGLILGGRYHDWGGVFAFLFFAAATGLITLLGCFTASRLRRGFQRPIAA